MLRTLSAFLILVSSAASAELMSCDLLEVTQIAEDGRTEPATFEELYKDTPIIVDTSTGVVDHFGLGNVGYSNIFVFDHGSSQSSFKSVGYSNEGSSAGTPFRNTVYFEISTFVSAASKPFILVSSGTVGTGFCQ